MSYFVPDWLNTMVDSDAVRRTLDEALYGNRVRATVEDQIRDMFTDEWRRAQRAKIQDYADQIDAEIADARRQNPRCWKCFNLRSVCTCVRLEYPAAIETTARQVEQIDQAP